METLLTLASLPDFNYSVVLQAPKIGKEGGCT